MGTVIDLWRAAPALALTALLVAGVSGVFLAGTANAQPSTPVMSNTPHSRITPSPMTPSPMTPSPAESPAETLPSTGADAGDVAVTGLASIAAGVILVSVWWVWQALKGGPAQVRGRRRLDRKPGHRHQ